MDSEYSVPESLDVTFSNVQQRRLISAYKCLREMESGKQPERVMRHSARQLCVLFDDLLTPISLQAKYEIQENEYARGQEQEQGESGSDFMARESDSASR